MPRTKRVDPEEQIEFVDDLPFKGGPGIHWGIVLQPLVDNPGQWAKVRTFDTPNQAMDAQSNLTKRHRLGLNVPMMDGDWSFASRGTTLYAIYRGGKKRRGSRPKTSIR
jgi:hypothetical protein